MKKIILIIFITFMIILLPGCKEENIIRKGSGDLIIELQENPTFGSKEDIENYYYIKIYDNKTGEFGFKNDEEPRKRKLSDKQYQKIINYAFSKKFSNLKEDLSDSSVMDGSDRYITIYFEDKTSKKIGGYNPNNDNFLEMVSLLYDITGDKNIDEEED